MDALKPRASAAAERQASLRHPAAKGGGQAAAVSNTNASAGVDLDMSQGKTGTDDEDIFERY
jgi:hypothetical protein